MSSSPDRNPVLRGTVAESAAAARFAVDLRTRTCRPTARRWSGPSSRPAPPGTRRAGRRASARPRWPPTPPPTAPRRRTGARPAPGGRAGPGRQRARPGRHRAGEPAHADLHRAAGSAARARLRAGRGDRRALAGRSAGPRRGRAAPGDDRRAGARPAGGQPASRRLPDAGRLGRRHRLRVRGTARSACARTPSLRPATRSPRPAWRPSTPRSPRPSPAPGRRCASELTSPCRTERRGQDR